MKKFFFAAVVLGSFLFVGAGVALADIISYSYGSGVFEHEIDFDNDTESSSGITYQEISDGNSSSNDFIYTHTLTGLSTPPETLSYAELTLNHKGNNTNSSLWLSWASTTSMLIGTLGDSQHGWLEETFDLVTPTNFLSLISGDPWALTVHLQETTNGTDKILIDYSILAGTYPYDNGTCTENCDGGDGYGQIDDVTPTPEPATMLLFGTGLVGAAGVVRRRKKSQT